MCVCVEKCRKTRAIASRWKSGHGGMGEGNKNGARALDGWKTNANEILTTPVTCYGPSWTKNRAHFFDLSLFFLLFFFLFFSPLSLLFCNTVRKPHGHNGYTWRGGKRRWGGKSSRRELMWKRNPVEPRVFILHAAFSKFFVKKIKNKKKEESLNEPILHRLSIK